MKEKKNCIVMMCQVRTLTKQPSVYVPCAVCRVSMAIDAKVQSKVQNPIYNIIHVWQIGILGRSAFWRIWYMRKSTSTDGPSLSHTCMVLV